MIESVLKVTDSHEAKLADSFKELLHKELQFGMSSYVCRYGTLSDGHEKITDSQRYYQALKESYSRAQSLKDYKIQALEAEANLLDAQEALNLAKTKQEELRAKAAHLKASTALENSLVMAEDVKRQLDTFLKVASELQDKVRAQYPNGIEQSEPDNWKAVTEYRAHQQQVKGTSLHLEHLPMPKEVKAAMGLKLGMPELVGWFAVEKNLEDRTPQGIAAALKLEVKPQGLKLVTEE
jgi:hypothetical protein